jgi:hypothetical protein
MPAPFRYFSAPSGANKPNYVDEAVDQYWRDVDRAKKDKRYDNGLAENKRRFDEELSIKRQEAERRAREGEAQIDIARGNLDLSGKRLDLGWEQLKATTELNKNIQRRLDENAAANRQYKMDILNAKKGAAQQQKDVLGFLNEAEGVNDRLRSNFMTGVERVGASTGSEQVASQIAYMASKAKSKQEAVYTINSQISMLPDEMKKKVQAEFKKIQPDMEAYFASQKALANLSKVMKYPGAVNVQALTRKYATVIGRALKGKDVEKEALVQQPVTEVSPEASIAQEFGQNTPFEKRSGQYKDFVQQGGIRESLETKDAFEERRYKEPSQMFAVAVQKLNKAYPGLGFNKIREVVNRYAGDEGLSALRDLPTPEARKAFRDAINQEYESLLQTQNPVREGKYWTSLQFLKDIF